MYTMIQIKWITQEVDMSHAWSSHAMLKLHTKFKIISISVADFLLTENWSMNEHTNRWKYNSTGILASDA